MVIDEMAMNEIAMDEMGLDEMDIAQSFTPAVFVSGEPTFFNPHIMAYDVHTTYQKVRLYHCNKVAQLSDALNRGFP